MTLNAGSHLVSYNEKKMVTTAFFCESAPRAILPGITNWISGIGVIVSLCIIVYYYNTVCLFRYYICCFAKLRREKKKERNKSGSNKAFTKEIELKSPLILYTCLTDN